MCCLWFELTSSIFRSNIRKKFCWLLEISLQEILFIGFWFFLFCVCLTSRHRSDLLTGFEVVTNFSHASMISKFLHFAALVTSVRRISTRRRLSPCPCLSLCRFRSQREPHPRLHPHLRPLQPQRREEEHFVSIRKGIMRRSQNDYASVCYHATVKMAFYPIQLIMKAPTNVAVQRNPII